MLKTFIPRLIRVSRGRFPRPRFHHQDSTGGDEIGDESSSGSVSKKNGDTNSAGSEGRNNGERDLSFLPMAKSGVITVQSIFVRNNIVFHKCSGTAFYIGERMAVTNAHIACEEFDVVVKGRAQKKWVQAALYGMFQNGRLFRMSIRALNIFHDLCITEIQNIDGLDLSYTFSLSLRLPEMGELLYFIGNPGFKLCLKSGIFSSVRTFNEIEKAQALRIYNIPSCPEFHCDVLEVEGTAAPGMSGSPLFTRHGEVVGVVFAGLDTIGRDPGSPCALAVPSLYIQELLDWSSKNPDKQFVHKDYHYVEDVGYSCLDSFLVNMNKPGGRLSLSSGLRDCMVPDCEESASKVPRLHCLVHRKLTVHDVVSISPVVEPKPNQVKEVREALLGHLTTICQILKFVSACGRALSVCAGKDSETNRLMSGVLQLAEGSHLTIDETHLQAGTLNTVGVENVRLLKNLLELLKVEYDFKYCKMEMATDVQLLVLSEGKSNILPADLVLPFRPISVGSPEIVDAEALKAWRWCLASVRSLPHSIEQEMQKVVEDDMVAAMQADRTLGSQDFSRWLTMSCWMSVHDVVSISPVVEPKPNQVKEVREALGYLTAIYQILTFVSACGRALSVCARKDSETKSEAGATSASGASMPATSTKAGSICDLMDAPASITKEASTGNSDISNPDICISITTC